MAKTCTVLLGAFVIVLLAMVGATGQMFTGAWTADMTLATVQTNPVTAFHSRLDAAFNFGPVSVGTQSDFSDSGWLWQSFQLKSTVAFFSLQADVLFTPDPWQFAYAGGFAKLDFGSFWTTYYVGFLGSMFEGAVFRGAVLELGTSLGATTVRSLTYLGATLDGILFSPGPSYAVCEPTDCVAPSWSERYYDVAPVQSGSLLFTGQQLIVESTICYDVTLTATTNVSATSFQSQEFHAEIWSIGALPINLDVSLVYMLQSKSLTIEPKFGLGNRNCYGQVLIDLVTAQNGTLITGFSVYGLDLFVEANSVGFRSLSIFDTVNFSLYRKESFSLADAVWVAPAGQVGICGSAGEELTEYWEVIGIGVYRGDGCNRTLSFLALSYFGDSGALFDWVESEFRVQMLVMYDLSLRTSVGLSSAGVSSWTLGLSIAW